jgi:benzoylformate decarboxylase
MTPAFMSGKDALLALLRQEGVEVLFGNPGTTELPLMDALATAPHPRYVLGLQEAAVVAMADGYAQASGRLAVVNLHVAPGLGNGLGMLYDAQKAGSPLFVTAGQHDQSFNLTEPILWADLPPIARPFVKWAAEVRRLGDLPRAVHRAAKTALAPPTGPVFLSLPVDVLQAEGEVELGEPTRVAPGIRGDRAAIEAAADLLAGAERPLIMAGDAVASSRAHAELVAVAERLGAPVYAEGIPSTASFPASHPLFRGALVRLAPAIRQVLSQADLLFSVGGDLLTMSLPSDVDPVPPGLPIVHLDTDAWELGKNYPARVAILGDPKATLPGLLAALEARMGPDARARAAARVEDSRAAKRRQLEELAARARADAHRVPVTPRALRHGVGTATRR